MVVDSQEIVLRLECILTDGVQLKQQIRELRKSKPWSDQDAWEHPELVAELAKEVVQLWLDAELNARAQVRAIAEELGIQVPNSSIV